MMDANQMEIRYSGIIKISDKQRSSRIPRASEILFSIMSSTNDFRLVSKIFQIGMFGHTVTLTEDSHRRLSQFDVSRQVLAPSSSNGVMSISLVIFQFSLVWQTNSFGIIIEIQWSVQQNQS